MSLLKKWTSGFIDSVKAAKLLLEKEAMSKNCLFLVDEIYLQKSIQFHGGNFIGWNEEGTLYKGIVVFMIMSLKKSIPFVGYSKAFPSKKLKKDFFRDCNLPSIKL